MVMACPQCFRTFPDETRYCGLCGVQLVARTLTEPLAQPQPSEESAYLGSLIDGRYRINRLIGRGGMGSVYEVEHVHMRKVLAMKLLHEDMVVRKQLVGRFTREARAVSRLNSDHTVRVYDFGRHEALFFLVMEYLDGEDLEVLLSREGALPWRRALAILDQVCQSLGEAHDAGIIHRDLKPENIMLVQRAGYMDFVKVLDFGLAKVTDMDDMFSVHSQRDLFGTPYYMSPEQIRGGTIDQRADIYALGCLAFRTLTNQHVYNAPYAFDVLRQHLTAAIPSVLRTLPEGRTPARVDRFVWRALQKRPENRFMDTAAMRREIAGCLEHPDGDSIAVDAPFAFEPAPEIDPDLERRLQAFEQSHQEAEARMFGDAPPPLPPDLPVGIAIDVPTGVDMEPMSDLAGSGAVLGPPAGAGGAFDEQDFGATGAMDEGPAFDPEYEPADDAAPPADAGGEREGWEHDSACAPDPGTDQDLPADDLAEMDEMGATLEMPAPWLRGGDTGAGSQGADGIGQTSAAFALEDPRARSKDSAVAAQPVRPSQIRPRVVPERVPEPAADLRQPAAAAASIDPDPELAYARRLRRNRRIRFGLGVGTLAAGIAFGLFLWSRHEPKVRSPREVEPNDSPTQANEIRPGTTIEGHIGKRLATFDSDRDHYRMSMGGSGRYLELELTPIPNLDLYVDVLDSDGRLLGHIDKDGMGQPETIHRFRVPTEHVLLKVSEAKAGDGRPTENISDAYALTADAKDPPEEEGEVEPNDTAAEANNYRPRTRFEGFLDGTKDVDHFVVSMDGQMDLRRWEAMIETDGSTLVPRLSLYRVVGAEAVLVFADEGVESRLLTVYEEPSFPNPEYLIAVSHSGRGERRGSYRLVADVLGKRERVAHENDDDRARATQVAIGEVIRGVVDGPRDVDMFVIPVTDPHHREVEVHMDGLLRDRLLLALTDVNSANVRQFPPPALREGRGPPQPVMDDRSPIRFRGDGEKYYLAVRPRRQRDSVIHYSFRVYRIMDEFPRPLVGGPDH